MFAIIRADGKQYRVTKGDTVRLARMSAKPGEVFETDQVLAIGGEENELKFGTPVIAGAKVQGTVLQHGKDKKVIVFKRKRRKTYRRKYGHRQAHTALDSPPRGGYMRAVTKLHSVRRSTVLHISFSSLRI